MNVKKTCYFGPFAPPNFGPGIKNQIIYNELKKYIQIDKYNSNSKLEILHFIIKIFTYKNIILAVSKRGRTIMLPIIYLQTLILRMFRVKINIIFLPMGGTLYKEIDSGVKGRLLKLIIRNLRVTFLEVETLKNRVLELGISNAKVFPNVKDIKNNVPPNNDNLEKLKLVYISRVREVKGIFILLDAVINLLNEGYDLTLDIYGSIEKDIELKFIDIINNNSKINYKGEIEFSNIGEVIRNYNTFVFPSIAKTEGFPGAFIDAFEYGLSIIASDIAYNSEIVKAGYNGLIYNHNSVSDLEDAIKKIIENKEIHKLFSKNNFNDRFKYDVKRNIHLILSELE